MTAPRSLTTGRGECILDAIKAQAEVLDQIIFAEYTHDPAERVAAELIGLAPSGLEHVFFSDSGSTGVEVALKMALGYWLHTGEQRHRIIVLEHGYHGDTIGSGSTISAAASPERHSDSRACSVASSRPTTKYCSSQTRS